MSDPTALTSTTQKFLDIYDIASDVAIMKDGSASMILSVDAINFALLAEEEQDAIIYAYAGLLNSINYPIQILIRSQTKDVSTYLHLLEDQEEQTTDQLKKQQIQQYRGFVSNLIQERNVLDKKFYVVIPASGLELGFVSAKSVVPGVQSSDIATYDRSVILEKAHNNLDPKRDHLIGQFARIGLYARQLNTQEIIQLFYLSYNPEASEGQRITDTGNYTTSVVEAQVQMVHQDSSPASTPAVAPVVTPVAQVAQAFQDQVGYPATPAPAPTAPLAAVAPAPVEMPMATPAAVMPPAPLPPQPLPVMPATETIVAPTPVVSAATPPAPTPQPPMMPPAEVTPPSWPVTTTVPLMPDVPTTPAPAPMSITPPQQPLSEPVATPTPSFSIPPQTPPSLTPSPAPLEATPVMPSEVTPPLSTPALESTPTLPGGDLQAAINSTLQDLGSSIETPVAETTRSDAVPPQTSDVLPPLPEIT